MNWIEDTLDNLDNKDNGRDESDFNKIIFMHHPIINPYSLFSLDMHKCTPRLNRKSFIDICKKYDVDVVLTGHTHENKIYDEYCNIRKGSEDILRFVQTGAAEETFMRKIFVKSDQVTVGPPIHVVEFTKYRALCPVDLYLVDSAGNYVSKEKNEIDNVYFSSMTYSDGYEEKSIIVYDDIGDYNVYIEGQDKGEFSLQVSDVSLDKYEIIEYNNITIDKGSKANIEIAQGDVGDKMEFDSEGDGVVDSQISPSNTSVFYSEIPEIIILSPVNNDEVKDDIVVKGVVNSDFIISIEIRIDSGEWKVVNTEDNWEYIFSINDLTEGTHVITARIWNGNVYSYDSVSITIKNPVFLLVLRAFSYASLYSFPGSGSTRV